MIATKLIDPQTWESFVHSLPHTLFVQSAGYGDFYRSMGEQAWILGVWDNDQLVGGSLVVSTHAKRGSFLYVPYGPLFAQGYMESAFPAWVDAVHDLAKKENLVCVRISPFWDDTPEARSIVRKNGFRKAPLHVLAETTWLLDLAPAPEALLAAMNKNHRNLIHRGEREGVRVTFSTDADAIGRFNAMHDATAARHRFHRFSASYIEKEFSAFARSGQAFVAESFLPDGRPDAAAVILSYGTMACYRHGASYGLEKRLPTSYVLQWRIIEEARTRGLAWYNFWGIAPKHASRKHPFAGITHFKTGFGGMKKQLLPCHDLPLKPSYGLLWGIDTFRRIIRGF